MHTEAETYAVEHLSWAGLGLFGLVGLGILILLTVVLSTLTGRSSHVRTPEQSRVAHRHRGPAILVPLMLVVFVSIGVMLLRTLNTSEVRLNAVPSPTHQIAQAEPPRELESSTPVARPAVTRRHTRPEPINNASFASADPFGSRSSSSPDENPENKNTEPDTEPLPEWTDRKRTVLAEGQVPKVLFVETSGLYSSEEEAMAEAMTKAVTRFHARLAETYHELAEQPVPENIFREASLQQVYTEKRIHKFGIYDEPMYRVYLQYIDSAEAREPIVDAWKSTFSSNRAMRLAIIFGILTAILGGVSVGLRAVSATKGNRSRSVMAALAFAGAGVATMLVLA